MWHGCSGEWWEAAYILAAFGGCRVGEALGATGRDVRMVEMHGVEAAVVSINKQINNFGKATDTLKNKWSYRSAVIPGPMGVRIGEIAKTAEFGYLTNNFGELCSQVTLNLAWKRFISSGYEAHPFRNLRNSWQTYNRWVLCLPPWITEKLMGHVGEGVTGQHYDRPDWELFADAVTEAYSKHPFADTKDKLGRENIMHAV
jgi:integrase